MHISDSKMGVLQKGPVSSQLLGLWDELACHTRQGKMLVSFDTEQKKPEEQINEI